MLKLLLLIGGVGLAMLGIYIWFRGGSKTDNISFVITEKQEYEVEAVSSFADMAKGLSGRENLDNGAGMLFLLSSERKPTFHMNNMRFPIDIVWIDKDRKVIGIEDNVQPWIGGVGKFYRPQAPIKYVLEVNARSGIEVGERVTFR